VSHQSATGGPPWAIAATIRAAGEINHCRNFIGVRIFSAVAPRMAISFNVVFPVHLLQLFPAEFIGKFHLWARDILQGLGQDFRID
jgi:hypothetical protein